ncbi:hypothetical protein UA08_09434 [Talaromyces atroroseus]|uniref:Uncharacterized protein n=1 Tax=Talaromyces atroroseus TaxID=1441469 RepID=A0A225AK76_TALAT|nr:hypothetical protein UA08_09434 [Talaromyces atroroseus]OKL55266.1 hypothetical protein UA08_09434 [Talaromyces atroroseus]
MDHDGQFFTEIITEIDPDAMADKPSPQCLQQISGKCFQYEHFDWCLSHQRLAITDHESVYEASVMNVYSSIEEYQRFLEDLYNNFEQQLNEAKSEKLSS